MVFPMWAVSDYCGRSEEGEEFFSLANNSWKASQPTMCGLSFLGEFGDLNFNEKISSTKFCLQLFPCHPTLPSVNLPSFG